MSLCVAIAVDGTVIEAVGETAPACSEFLLMAPAELNRMTFWADLAMYLDPSQPDLWLIMSAALLVFAGAFGWRVLARQLFNR